MKKDCAYTRKSLRKYLRGHLFKYEQVRIARHLNICPLCRSEFQALKKVADTKQLLKDITPPEGIAGRMRASMFGLAKLKLLLYRPLWLAAVIGVAVLIYINLIAPRRHDIEIENIEKSLPPAATIASAPTISPVSALVSATLVQEAATAASAPAVEPLVITITPYNYNEAVHRINEVMRGHGQLRKLKFSDTVREISGNLTAKELLTFFNRIEPAGTASYSRMRFESFPAAQPIPFVMKMKASPKATHQLSSPAPTAYKHGDEAAALPASAPTQTVP